MTYVSTIALSRPIAARLHAVNVLASSDANMRTTLRRLSRTSTHIHMHTHAHTYMKREERTLHNVQHGTEGLDTALHSKRLYTSMHRGGYKQFILQRQVTKDSVQKRIYQAKATMLYLSQHDTDSLLYCRATRLLKHTELYRSSHPPIAEETPSLRVARFRQRRVAAKATADRQGHSLVRFFLLLLRLRFDRDTGAPAGDPPMSRHRRADSDSCRTRQPPPTGRLRQLPTSDAGLRTAGGLGTAISAMPSC